MKSHTTVCRRSVIWSMKLLAQAAEDHGTPHRGGISARVVRRTRTRTTSVRRAGAAPADETTSEAVRLMRYAIDAAQTAGCYKVQLHSGKQRAAEAHEFYRRVGFAAVAEGFKLYL
jgi:GNAT superfamily N-acetyltransferase